MPNYLRRSQSGRTSSAVALAVGLAFVSPAAAGDDRKLEYNRDVRPILSEYCFSCHGPDSAARKADLRLDRRDDAVKAGAITPDDPDASELVARVTAAEADQVMPPPASKKPLSDAQKDVLKRWVAAGAEYQPHWAFIAPGRPTPPAVADEAWVRNPVDRFVLAKLAEKGLKPAPEADRRTLARRVSLDLTGLPPKPEAVEAFVADAGPDAYEKYVDRMLASEDWGEHRARYWLDAARYADTHGIHFDNYREMWSYRDWVINAFNKNMPFDAFTVEQLAGDLLPGRTVDQQVASGFNRCHITTNEGGAINEEYLVLYTRDRTEAASQVFLGLTTGCAVCHDHKFDPFSQKEFYELSAFFNNTTQAAMDGNVKDTPPTVVVPRAEDRERWSALATAVLEVKPKAEARRAAARADFDRWAADAGAGFSRIAESVPADGLRLHAPLGEGVGTSTGVTTGGVWRQFDFGKGGPWQPGHVSASAVKIGPDFNLAVPGVGDFERDQAFSVGAWVKTPNASGSGAVVSRMDEAGGHRGWDLWVEGNRPGMHLINAWPGNALKVLGREPLKPGQWQHVLVTYDGSGRAAGVKVYVDGKPKAVEVKDESLTGSIRTAAPLTVGRRTPGARFDGVMEQDLRIYGRALAPGEVAALAGSTRAGWLASRPMAARTPAEADELFGWWLANLDAESPALGRRLADLEREQTEVRNRGTVGYVMQERGGTASAFVLNRGEYDKRKDEVHPRTPDALPPMGPDLPRDRLGLARWLLRPEHPLTARVTVNRFWQEVFGTGLVRTTGDFGVTGETPSHPELLDWLAVDFREGGWDVKRFFRLLVTSAAYRQSALGTPEAAEKDPSNRLLSHGPRFRMDAEMVRDYALAAGGLLVRKVGGPSVKPYQPDGVWEAVAMDVSDTRSYRRDAGDKLYRRSLYTFWKRAAPPASMEIFNAPSREVCTVRRERTNTPLQALVTLNDPQFVESARHLAQETLKGGESNTEGRLDLMARRLLARPLRPEEGQIVSASLADLLAHYQAHPDDARALAAVGETPADPKLDAPTVAAWTMLANEMMNLDEVLNK